MAKVIFWSPLAEKDLENILTYLEENWSEQVLTNFIAIVEEIISIIRANPHQYPLIHKKKKIRKCVLTKHNTLFYQIGSTEIAILRIFDNRQDPRKLKFK